MGVVLALVLIFGAVALVAACFAVLPLYRASRKSAPESRRGALLPAVLAGAAIMAVGGGAYAYLGQPAIAVSALSGPNMNDYVSLVATLARRMPYRPDDAEGWTLLGRGYLALNNPGEAEKALSRAVMIDKAERGAAPPALLSSYGEAMAENAGSVTKEAEAVFREALAEDPRELMSRYYVGLALATRGDKTGALSLWEGVIADAPADAPWRGNLVDQVAGLKAQTGGAAPNPAVMVAALAQRLDSNPNDLQGWLRLIRAYAVLGDKTKAVAALTRARSVFASQADAQTALAEAAKENALN